MLPGTNCPLLVAFALWLLSGVLADVWRQAVHIYAGIASPAVVGAARSLKVLGLTGKTNESSQLCEIHALIPWNRLQNAPLLHRRRVPKPNGGHEALRSV